MLIEHWGLHWDGPYPYLVEPEGSVCLLEGHDWAGDFTSPKLPCPHHLLKFANIKAEPVAWNPFLPLPDTQAYTYKGPWNQFPVQVEAWWAKKPAQLSRQLITSNLTPLCIIGYRWSDLDNIVRLLELPRLRSVVFLGDFTIPGTIECFDVEPFTPAEGLAALRNFVNETAPGSV